MPYEVSLLSINASINQVNVISEKEHKILVFKLTTIENNFFEKIQLDLHF